MEKQLQGIRRKIGKYMVKKINCKMMKMMIKMMMSSLKILLMTIIMDEQMRPGKEKAGNNQISIIMSSLRMIKNKISFL